MSYIRVVKRTGTHPDCVLRPWVWMCRLCLDRDAYTLHRSALADGLHHLDLWHTDGKKKR